MSISYGVSWNSMGRRLYCRSCTFFSFTPVLKSLITCTQNCACTTRQIRPDYFWACWDPCPAITLCNALLKHLRSLISVSRKPFTVHLWHRCQDGYLNEGLDDDSLTQSAFCSSFRSLAESTVVSPSIFCRFWSITCERTYFWVFTSSAHNEGSAAYTVHRR